METIVQALERIIPVGTTCAGCPKSDPHGIKGYSGDVFCHLLEETIENGDKECGINDPRCPDEDPEARQVLRWGL